MEKEADVLRTNLFVLAFNLIWTTSIITVGAYLSSLNIILGGTVCGICIQLLAIGSILMKFSFSFLKFQDLQQTKYLPTKELFYLLRKNLLGSILILISLIITAILDFLLLSPKIAIGGSCFSICCFYWVIMENYICKK